MYEKYKINEIYKYKIYKNTNYTKNIKYTCHENIRLHNPEKYINYKNDE
jgi:hypothetical protein